ncbi:hypothetical protein [Lysinibacillus antri]|uniref:Tryptophan-rich sensory protein n=1 Tax=Lysinibacillus antri TaxID=2498145 RepID=A0A432LAL5_9BACI|nr:hypothetical protein [Lysinibacillus antri]RUL51606.1 hypothetical protein EK386_12085 [Lysinibacillus antri]
MSRLIAITIFLIVTIFFTINAFWLQLAGHSTLEIINRLPILFAPASFVYFIWFIVFIFLFLWIKNYWTLRQSEKFISTLQTSIFIFILILQIASLFSWHHEHFIQSIIFLGIQLISLFALYLTYPLKMEMLKLRIPIAIYFSWTTFLFILHFCYILVHTGWNGFGLSNALWAVIIMTIGTAIALHLRYHHYDIAYPIIFIWCYIGIAIANGFDELLVTTAALFLTGVLMAGIFLMKKNPARLN